MRRNSPSQSRAGAGGGSETVDGSTLAWVEARAAGRVLHVEPIAGGTWTSSQLHRIDLGSRRLVLRSIVDEAWLALEPDLALHEAAALERVSGLAVATPRLVAVDASGRETGHPAVLMSEVSGKVWITPSELDRYVDDLAHVLAQIHAVDPNGFAWRHRSWVRLADCAVPRWARSPDLFERAIAAVREGPPAEGERFLHRDYHPMNLLFGSRGPSGVVDWINACRGPASADLAHCRRNLLGMFGIAAADRFLGTYLRIAGRGAGDYHPFWDLEVALDGLPDRPEPYAPWAHFGLDAARGRSLVARTEVFVARALDRLG